jgi:hypothetical protein
LPDVARLTIVARLVTFSYLADKLLHAAVPRRPPRTAASISLMRASSWRSSWIARR